MQITRYNTILEVFNSFNNPEHSEKIALNFINNDPMSPKKVYRKKFRNLYNDILQSLMYFSSADVGILQQNGKKIAIIGTNCYEWILAFYAIILSGNKAVLIDPNLHQSVIQNLLLDAEVTGAFVSLDVFKKCQAFEDTFKPINVVVFKSIKNVRKKIHDFYDVFDVMMATRDMLPKNSPAILEKIEKIAFKKEEECVYIYTSGTTSSPKAVGLSTENIFEGIYPTSEGMNPQNDVLLSILPFYHIFGLSGNVLGPNIVHFPNTILREISSVNLIRAIQLTDVSVIIAVPAFLKLIYNSILDRINNSTDKKSYLIRKYLYSSEKYNIKLADKLILSFVKNRIGKKLRAIIIGAAKTNDKYINFFERIGIAVREGYGLTETAASVTFNTLKKYKLGSVGLPMGDTNIVIKNKDELGNGEIWLKGKTVFKGYLVGNKIDRTCFDSDGFFNTGDIGKIDADGYLFITGRKKDIIVLESGKNVYPDELELHYSESLLIKEISVLGVNSEFGEQVHAVIFANYDKFKEMNSKLGLTEVIQNEITRLSSGLPSYKRINNFTLVNHELPKTSSRKVKKHELYKFINENIAETKDSKELETKNKNYNVNEHNEKDVPVEQGLIDIDFIDPIKLEGLILTLVKKNLPTNYLNASFKEIADLPLEGKLGIDSITRLEIFYTLCEKLKIKPISEGFNSIITLNDFVHYITNYKKKIETTDKVSSYESSDVHINDGFKEDISREYFEKYTRPILGRFLRLLKMDVIYHKAIGNYLYYYSKNGEEKKVIDFVGGYGSVIMGHNCPAIVNVAKQNLNKHVAFQNQLSIRSQAAILAKAINDLMQEAIARDFVTTFANSGTEATEAAIKHANFLFIKKVKEFYDSFRVNQTKINEYFRRNKCDRFHILDKDFSTSEEVFKYLEEYNSNKLKENEPNLLAAKKSFHGKTNGSMLITFKEDYRIPFLGPDLHADFFSIDEEDVSSKISAANFQLMNLSLSPEGKILIVPENFNKYTALFIEPIQGEGGVNLIPNKFLQFLREICSKNKIFLVFDEIQSGFFRTGKFLASFESGVAADSYLMGKSIGGGISKIGCMLVDSELYQEEFGLLHTSTFAEDDYSSSIALASIEYMKNKTEKIVEMGDYIHKKLLSLKEQYPALVKDVRGKGLMQAIEFNTFLQSKSGAFQLLSCTGFFNYVISGYLLNTHGIRVGAPLSSTSTIRIQPTIEVSYEDIDKLYLSLLNLCKIFYNEDLYKFVEYILDDKDKGLRSQPEDHRVGKIHVEKPEEGAYKVGFLIHYVDNAIKLTEPSLMALEDSALVQFMQEFLPVAKPLVVGSKNVKDITGKITHITFIGLPITSKMYKNSIGTPEEELYVKLCQSAVDTLITEHDVKLIGFGQYSSIITGNCQKIASPNVGLTSGNTYTAYSSVEQMLKKIVSINMNPAEECLGVIGAGGNICSTFANYYSRYTAKIRLLGGKGEKGYNKAAATAKLICLSALNELKKNSGIPKGELQKLFATSNTYKMYVANELKDYDLMLELHKEFGPDMPVIPVRELTDLHACRMIICATNEPEPFLKPEHFQNGSVVCDISVPTNCTKDLFVNEKNIHVLKGGVIQLPHNEILPIMGFPLKAGESYACISEAILLGFEEYQNCFSYGPIDVWQMELIEQIAKKHGFTVKLV